MQRTEVRPRRRRVVLKVDGSAVGGLGFVKPLLAGEQHAEVDVRLGDRGIGGQRASIVVFGLRRIAGTFAQIGEIGVRLGEVGCESQRSAEGGFGPGHIALGQLAIAGEEQRFGLGPAHDLSFRSGARFVP